MPPYASAETEDAAEDPQGHAFEQELSRKTLPVGAERRAQRELLLAGVGADEKQVGDVGAGDEENQAHGAEEDPENVSDVAHDVLLEGHDVGIETGLLQHLERQPPGILLRGDGDHPGHVGVGLVDPDSRFEPGNPLIAEISHEDLCRVELERKVEVGLESKESKLLREDAHDLPRLSIDCDRPSQDFGVGAEAPLPIGFAEEDGQRGSGGVVLGSEDAPELGLHPQEGERSVGHAHRLDPLGLGEPRHRDLLVVPHADLVEDLTQVAVGEMERWRLVDLVETEAGGRVPDPDERFRFVERKRLQEDAVDDAEDRGVRADAEREGSDRDQGEHGGAKELPKKLPGRRAQECDGHDPLDEKRALGSS